MRTLAALALISALLLCHAHDPAIAEELTSTTAIDPADELQTILRKYDFDGTIAISGGRLDGFSIDQEQVWPWASVTKQVIATLVMQLVEAGLLKLDEPVSAYLSDWRQDNLPAPTLRQLLRHQSGLYDPEDDPLYSGNNTLPLDPAICVARRTTAPGGQFNYANCDFIWVGRVIERVTSRSLPELVDEHISKPLNLEATGFVRPGTALAPNIDGTPAQEIAHYGAAGGLAGTASDLLNFDEALLGGALLSEEARTEMWRGDPALGYTALGQWDTTLPLAGCNVPVRVIERRGAIGGYQARNYILPDLGVAVVAFIGRGEDQYPFGEAWSGEGLSYELLSAAACGA